MLSALDTTCQSDKLLLTRRNTLQQLDNFHVRLGLCSPLAPRSPEHHLAAPDGRLASSFQREMTGECACTWTCVHVCTCDVCAHVSVSEELVPALSLPDWECVWQWWPTLATPVLHAAYGVGKILVTSFPLQLLTVEQPKTSAFMFLLYIKRTDPALFSRGLVCRELSHFFPSSCVGMIHLLIVFFIACSWLLPFFFCEKSLKTLC